MYGHRFAMRITEVLVYLGFLLVAIASLLRTESVLDRHRTVGELPLRAVGNSSLDKVVSSWGGHEPASSLDGPVKGQPQPRTSPLHLIESQAARRH